MPLDPTITMGFRPPQIDDPLEMAGAAQVMSLNRMKMDAAQQEMEQNAMLMPQALREQGGKADKAQAEARLKQLDQFRQYGVMIVGSNLQQPQKQEAWGNLLQMIGQLSPEIAQQYGAAMPQYDDATASNVLRTADQALKTARATIDTGDRKVRRSEAEYGTGKPRETSRGAKDPHPAKKPK